MFTSPRSTRHAHYLSAAGVFGVLGFHVGAWAVQLAPLSISLDLNPASLGTAVAMATACGLVTVFAGGSLADGFGDRPVLVVGFAGTGTSFVLLALAGTFTMLLPAVMLYGLSVSFIDLGANTVGSAYEQAHATTAMTGLHAWFSGGAFIGALASAAALYAGASYRAVYLGLAAIMAATLVAVLLAALPAPNVHADDTEDVRPQRGGELRAWRIPAVLFAIALISITFFADGALESFLSTYLQRTLSGGVLLSGAGIASYHPASLLGRLAATAALRRLGEKRVVIAAGLLAAAGLLITVSVPGAAIRGLLLAGFAVAPVAPAVLSLAGRSAPGRSGQVVAATTAAGYSAFIISPLTIGLLAQATSLRLALAVLIPTRLAIAALATRWPRSPAASSTASSAGPM